MKQLEAFEGTRVRKKVIVRPGHTAWWGVDPSTKRVAIAAIGPRGERASHVESVPALDGAARLEAIRVATKRAAAELAPAASGAEWDGSKWVRAQTAEPWPGVILVEQPSGKHVNPELSYAVGAVLCGLASLGARIELVASSKWKLAVCGYGAISKPKPTSKDPYRVLEWARETGYIGKSWDEADAWAIAEYARLTCELDPR